jgi:hypothetical protein
MSCLPQPSEKARRTMFIAAQAVYGRKAMEQPLLLHEVVLVLCFAAAVCKDGVV